MLERSPQAVSSYECKSALIVIQRRSIEGYVGRNGGHSPTSLDLRLAVTWEGEQWAAELFVPSLLAHSKSANRAVTPLKVCLSEAHPRKPDHAPLPDVTAVLTLDAGYLDVDIASTTPLHLFWAVDGCATYISTDVRWLPDVATSLIDPGGVYALLKFRSCVPPFTIWRHARRFPPGVRTRFDLSQQQVVASAKSESEWLRSMEPSERRNCGILEALDSYLARATNGRRPVVFFSGGVDSTLLAWRLQSIGRKDIILLHSTKDHSNPETLRARAIAEELQLELVETKYDRSYALAFFSSVGQKMPYPIGSMSIIETAQICDRVAEFGPEAIAIDGTGADGLFGMLRAACRIARVELLPHWSRQLGRRLYDAYLWRRPSGLVGKVAGVVKRSALASPAAMLAVAPDPFEDIFYHVDARTRQTVLGDFCRWSQSVTSARDPLLMQCRALDLMSVCAGNYAQKSFGHFAAREENVVFPFLDREVVATAMAHCDLSSNGRQEKSELKRLLATRVSPALVYAKKFWFQHDVVGYLCDPDFCALVSNALSTCDRDLGMLLHRERIRRVFQEARRGRSVPVAHMRMAWNAALLILWHSQVIAAHDSGGSSRAEAVCTG